MTEAARRKEGVPPLHFPFKGMKTVVDKVLEVLGGGDEAPDTCELCGAKSDLLWDVEEERWCPACVRDKARREGVLG